MHGHDIGKQSFFYEHEFYVFSNCLPRTVLGNPRDNETITGLYKLMKHVFYKKYHLGYRKGKPTATEIIEPHKHKVVILSSFKEINDFMNSL